MTAIMQRKYSALWRHLANKIKLWN